MQSNVMSPTDVRTIIKNLRSNLNQDTLLLADFHNNPHAVLHNAGLSRQIRQNMLQYQPETPLNQANCFCASYISVLTTILTTAAGGTSEPTT